jgi:hypothetical protein
MYWYEPADFAEWLKRFFSIANLIVLIFISVFIYSEFKYNWCENIIGIYLASTNDQRPETGTIWDSGKQAFKAHENLSSIIDKNQNIRETAGKALSFAELLSGIKPEEWVTLETQQIKTLYQSLDRELAFKIINPAKLIWILNSDTVDRIFCKGTEQGIKIFFVDADNRVIQEITIRKEDIIATDTDETPAKYGSLEEVPGFGERIFPAEIFFKELMDISEDIIPDLISDPKLLLDQKGIIKRVGIDNEVKSGYIKIGFEFHTTEGAKIVFVNSREWAVWQLIVQLRLNNNERLKNTR